MPKQTGSCLCGNIKIEFDDENHKRILCHCLDCRKITGCHYSDNGVVTDSQFKLISGTPKEYRKTADSGKAMTSFFCGDCGTTVWRVGEFMPGHIIVKTGVVDDAAWQSKAKPQAELFEERRVEWVPVFAEKTAAA